MKKVLRLTLVVFIVVMTTVLASCGKTALPEKQILDNVYKLETYELPEGMDYVSEIFTYDNGYMIYGTFEDEEFGYTDRFAKLDSEFNFVEFIDVDLELEDGTDPYLGNMRFSDDGGLFATLNTYYYDDVSGYSESKNYLIRTDSEFNIEKKMLTSEIMGLENGDYAYIYQLTPLSDGKLAFLNNEDIYIIDKDFNVIYNRSCEDFDAEYINYVLNTPRGLVVVYADHNWDNTAVVFDETTMTFSEPYDFSNNGYNYYSGNGSYDIYYVEDDGIYGLKFDDNEGVQLMDYLNSDVMDFYPSSLIPEEKDTFICTAWNYDDEVSNMVIYRLVPVPDEEIEPKYIITLGTVGMNYNIKRHVYKFNRSNPEYRITISDYSANVDYGEDSEYTYEDAVNKLNSDIAAGNVPDIFVGSESIPFESYAAQGIFEDLGKLIEADEDLNIEDFEQNVVEALKTDGKLYRISPVFVVQGFAGLESTIGEYADNWNNESFMKLAESLGEDTEMIQNMTKSNFMDGFMPYMYSGFINFGTGKCDFTSGAFADMLEYAATLKENSIWDDDISYDSDFWDDYEKAYAEGRAILSYNYVSGFDQIVSLINYTFRTDDITLVGFPTSTGNPVIDTSNSDLSISSKSKVKEGAWEFISSLLSDEYQSNPGYSLPIVTEYLEKLKEKELESAKESKENYYANIEGRNDTDDGFTADTSVVVADATYGIISEEYGSSDVRYFLEEEYADMIMDFIRSADGLCVNDTEISNIVSEEADRFFNGQCTSDEAANAVQSRVSIYLSENR